MNGKKTHHEKRPSRPRRLRSESGSVILLAMFLVFFIGLIVGTFLFIARSDLEIATNHLKENQALYCADAGIEQAIWNLRKYNPAGYKCGTYQGSAAGAACFTGGSDFGGTFGYSIVSSVPVGTYYSYGGDANDGLIKTINATGTVGVFTKSIQATVKVSGFALASSEYVRCGVQVRSWEEVY